MRNRYLISEVSGKSISLGSIDALKLMSAPAVEVPAPTRSSKADTAVEAVVRNGGAIASSKRYWASNTT
jgi:hypothetical protein